MKKLFLFGITVTMLFSLAACGGEDNKPIADHKADGTFTFEVGEPNGKDIPYVPT